MREIFIERREKILRIAIKEKGKLVDCLIEEETSEALPGEIYLGTVKNIVPGIKSAFIDIGLSVNAFMSLDSNSNIKQGQEVIVEVLKEAIGDKGPKVTCDFSIPGKYAVISSKGKGISRSKRILDEVKRTNLMNEIQPKPEGLITLRTNAAFGEFDDIKNEIDLLYERYLSILQKGKFLNKPQRIYGENLLLNKILRDNINNETKNIYVNTKEDHEVACDYINIGEEVKVHLYDDERSLFDYYHIEKEILSLRHKKVQLNSGGWIIIDKTEAMYVIDVNSGKHTKGKQTERVAEETNKEAALEIARQIRLRNLGGIILIDFIDMRNDEDKQQVLNILSKGLEKDKKRTTIYPFTELNLVQISRTRSGKSIFEYIEEDCELCKGKGNRLSLSYILMLIRDEILRYESENSIKDFYIEINAQYETYIREDIFAFLSSIEGLEKKIYLHFVQEVEYFKLEPLLFKKQIESVENYLVN